MWDEYRMVFMIEALRKYSFTVSTDQRASLRQKSFKRISSGYPCTSIDSITEERSKKK